MGEKEIFDQLKYRGEQRIVFKNGNSIKVSGFACDFNDNDVDNDIYACSNHSNPILGQIWSTRYSDARKEISELKEKIVRKDAEILKLQIKNHALQNWKEAFQETRKNYNKFLLSQLIDKVILNDPATIVFWQDGTKTIVKCQNGDKFDPEKGIAMAFMKRQYGNKGYYMDEINKNIPKEKEDPKSKK